ncbi:unnamed protein product [Mycena citricolor]|uniref:Glucose-methanol-choline oxidoreductase N-terminal domain-containing protein n=1 Tax=Mycena citricolor TaxID=2018698 RepID=A0AAD2HEQ6_9AGAR|nr:unnamed protein product [Mycena citricolor]
MVQPQEVDVIVAGGGPGGCVVAGRLAVADPSLKVMLIEGGANNRDDPWVSSSGRSAAQDSDYLVFKSTGPSFMTHAASFPRTHRGSGSQTGHLRPQHAAQRHKRQGHVLHQHEGLVASPRKTEHCPTREHPRRREQVRMPFFDEPRRDNPNPRSINFQIYTRASASDWGDFCSFSSAFFEVDGFQMTANPRDGLRKIYCL